MRKCTQCRQEREEASFLCARGRERKTCERCRTRSVRSRNKHKERRRENSRAWREKNKERVQIYNEMYRNDGRDWEAVKTKNNIPDSEFGPSAHRKLHSEQNGEAGKTCSACNEWKVLKGFYRMKCHWDGLRTECKECVIKARPICEHGRRPHQCTEDSCAFTPGRKCAACRSKLVNHKGDLCAGCKSEYGIQRIKKFEKQVEEWLEEAGLPWSYSNKKLPCAPTTRYPDYLFVGKEHVVLLEVDENQHRRYELKCEVARISEIMDSIDSKNLHVIRYNPHTKKDDAQKKEELLNAINAALEMNIGALSDTGCAVQYLNYSEDRIQALDEISCQA